MRMTASRLAQSTVPKQNQSIIIFQVSFYCDILSNDLKVLNKYTMRIGKQHLELPTKILKISLNFRWQTQEV